MKICSSCHAPNRDEANFCGVCGTHMSPPPPPPPPVSHSVHCNACGSENEEGANFCETCGAFLKQSGGDASVGSSAGQAPLPLNTPAPEADEAATVIDSSDVAATEIGPSADDLTIVDSSDDQATQISSSADNEATQIGSSVDDLTIVDSLDDQATQIDSSANDLTIVDSLDNEATQIGSSDHPTIVGSTDNEATEIGSSDDALTVVDSSSPSSEADDGEPTSVAVEPLEDEDDPTVILPPRTPSPPISATPAPANNSFSFIECANCDTVMRYCPCCGKPLSEVGMIKHD